MKPALIIVIFSLPLLLFSCDSSIDYLGRFNQQYSLNCILRGDQKIQYATLKRTYPADINLIEDDVGNALITLTLPDTTLLFRDSLLSDSKRGNSSVRNFYYLDNFRLPKGTNIKIKAVLPDSIILTSETKSIGYYVIFLDTKDPILPGTDNKSVFLTWQLMGNQETIILNPSLYIRYFISGSENMIRYKKVKGLYHKQANALEVFNSELDIAMSELSGNISDKSAINIIDGCLEVKLCDIPSGIYLNSSQTFEDEFSIRISETDYTNISGGLGIFGSYISEKFIIPVSLNYISSFGYNPAFAVAE